MTEFNQTEKDLIYYYLRLVDRQVDKKEQWKIARQLLSDVLCCIPQDIDVEWKERTKYRYRSPN
jgi:hypothetical protein